MPIKRRNKAKAEFSMSSLTDIVFLLLIFFMLTSSFVTPNALKLLLPKSTSPAMTAQPVTISITGDLEYFVTTGAGRTTKVNFDRLSSVIGTELSTAESKTIVVAADKNVTLEELVKVMNIGKKLNAKVVLATEPE